MGLVLVHGKGDREFMRSLQRPGGFFCGTGRGRRDGPSGGGTAKIRDMKRIRYAYDNRMQTE